MISWDFVLQRVKEEIAWPFQVIERSDEEWVDYLKRNALKKFSRFFPAKERITIDSTNPDTKVPNRIGEYFMVDPDNRQILNILQYYPTMGHLLILGHPYVGVFNYESMPDYALATNKANDLEKFSPYNYTYEFIPPNIFRITPDFQGRWVVEYERMISDELEDIRPELEDDFIELCLGMVMMNIGRIRKRYTNIATPFGSIDLNSEDFFSEGKEMVDKLFEKFDRMCLPTVIFDRG